MIGDKRRYRLFGIGINRYFMCKKQELNFSVLHKS